MNGISQETYGTKQFNAHVVLSVVLCAIVSVMIYILLGRSMTSSVLVAVAILLIIFKAVPVIVLKYVK